MFTMTISWISFRFERSRAKVKVTVATFRKHFVITLAPLRHPQNQNGKKHTHKLRNVYYNTKLNWTAIIRVTIFLETVHTRLRNYNRSTAFERSIIDY